MSTRKIKTPGEAGNATVDQADDASTTEQEAPSAPAAAGLPNAIDIDPKTIRGAVQTNQGWICPDESGKRPVDALRP